MEAKIQAIGMISTIYIIICIVVFEIITTLYQDLQPNLMTIIRINTLLGQKGIDKYQQLSLEAELKPITISAMKEAE